MMKKRLPIGFENFSEIRQENLYYVDKTGFIKELLDNFSKVTLFTRPRRFGKSLNMSMLKHFFQIGADKHLFDGLEITQEKEICDIYMGQYPVISVSLKDIEGRDYADALEQVWSIIKEEGSRHREILESDRISEEDKKTFKMLLQGIGNLADSLRFFSKVLYQYYQKKVIILIDEYDVPLDKSFQRGYYEEMVLLIRQIFNAVLKTNEYLAFAVLTGCLRISKESIFTGLNNLSVNTVADDKFSRWFGFLDHEVKEMLDYYELEEYYELTKEWYDGYYFGNTQVYCPWDVINWCSCLQSESDKRPRNFWVNTSSNDLIIRFAEDSDEDTKEDIEALIAGKCIWKDVKLDLTYPEIEENPENLWSVLYSTGYLTSREKNEEGYYGLEIPNKEVEYIFKEKIKTWFSKKIISDKAGLREFSTMIENRDAVGIEEYLNDVMLDSISFYDGGDFDVKENFYHGMLLGLLKSNQNWRVLSNREAGNGRADIIIVPKRTNKNKNAVIIEVKYATTQKELPKMAEKGLEQIKEQGYDAFFGTKRGNEIIHYGMAFYKKNCVVLVE